MARRARKQSETGFYHITNRGVNKADVFLDSEDHRRFLDCLKLAHNVCAFHLVAYCIMTNHFHIIIRCNSENPIPPSLFQSIGARFSAYYHRKYRTAGQVFQGRFRSEAIESESHLMSAIRYVWNNPVDAGICNVPAAYAWSSFNLLDRENCEVDNRFLKSLMSVQEWKNFALKKNTDWHLEPFSIRRDDEMARLFVQKTYGEINLKAVIKMQDERAFSLIEKCRSANMSIPQIARIADTPAKNLLRHIRRMRRLKKSAYP